MKKRINTGLDEESEWTHVQHRVLYVIKVLLWSMHGPSQRPLSAAAAPFSAASSGRVASEPLGVQQAEKGGEALVSLSR